MKEITFISLFFFTVTVYSQWQQDLRLSDNDSTSRTTVNNTWCIAAYGDTIHVVWFDKRDGNYEIYYRRSFDNGVNWDSETRLTNDTSYSQYPSIAVSGAFVHIVWLDTRDGNINTYYKRSTDAGTTWSMDTKLINDTNLSYINSPCIAVNGQIVHFVWSANIENNDEIFYKCSTNAGISWGQSIRLTNNVEKSIRPSVSVSGAYLHVTWSDFRDANDEIYYKRSTNAGLNWGADIRLTYDNHLSVYPSIASSGMHVHIAWQDSYDINDEIHYIKSSDGGSSWSQELSLTNDPNESLYPSICASYSNVHVVWDENRDGHREVYYKYSSNGGVNWGTDTRLTFNPNGSFLPSITACNTTVHVAFTDYRDNNYEIYYKRNPTGNPIGIQSISSEIPFRFSLSQNYPNPFNSSTFITYTLPAASDVKLKIYDVTGRLLSVLVITNQQAGEYKLNLDANNFASGVYFYKLEARQAGSSTRNYVSVKKMVLVK